MRSSGMPSTAIPPLGIPGRGTPRGQACQSIPTLGRCLFLRRLRASMHAFGTPASGGGVQLDSPVTSLYQYGSPDAGSLACTCYATGRVRPRRLACGARARKRAHAGRGEGTAGRPRCNPATYPVGRQSGHAEAGAARRRRPGGHRREGRRGHEGLQGKKREHDRARPDEEGAPHAPGKSRAPWASRTCALATAAATTRTRRSMFGSFLECEGGGL